MSSSVTINVLAQASQAAYGGQMGSPWVNLDVAPQGSSLASDMSQYNYSAQAYLNTTTGELIIANRGTKPSSLNTFHPSE